VRRLSFDRWVAFVSLQTFCTVSAYYNAFFVPQPAWNIIVFRTEQLARFQLSEKHFVLQYLK